MSNESVGIHTTSAAMENVGKAMQSKSDTKPKTSRRRRKKRPHQKGDQPKIMRFFKPKTNQDGYPMSHCRLHPALQTQVYCPPGYGNSHKSNQELFLKHFCLHCMLSPCITEEYSGKACSFSYDMTSNSNHKVSNAVVRSETAIFLQKEHCKLFKRRYGKNKEIPLCIWNHVETDLFVYGWDGEWDGEEESLSSEDEQEFEY